MRGVTHYPRNSHWQRLFQLTRLMRGVTLENIRFYEGYKIFQLTRLMRGVTV